MDKKTIIATAGGALVTLIIGAVFASLMGTFERGSDALTEDSIKKVLEETLVTTINGETKTYGEALSIINEKQIVMEQALIALTED